MTTERSLFGTRKVSCLFVGDSVGDLLGRTLGSLHYIEGMRRVRAQTGIGLDAAKSTPISRSGLPVWIEFNEGDSAPSPTWTTILDERDATREWRGLPPLNAIAHACSKHPFWCLCLIGSVFLSSLRAGLIFAAILALEMYRDMMRWEKYR